ncbi:hypothetical protein [Escherichia coli ISC41]|nr:hypothetical protein [Escherichia coli ISC41]
MGDCAANRETKCVRGRSAITEKQRLVRVIEKGLPRDA